MLALGYCNLGIDYQSWRFLVK